ncbi:hypothetical protein SCP_0501810 [Sparassis crispa]|uniref:Uncharacterized protein n=1 Tax=Sparassis crispa TaxID=139825 RepID=A0A401GN07_9APHY|nr:hypothetical protein SCP_0501810 [Sparassis crispa]GBE83134.1 hypothetical protein SCP_0501810 [Sparassis crispa]
MPWSMYATELGIYVAYRDTYHDLEVVPTDKLAAAVALLPTTSRRLGADVLLWIVHLFDRMGIEPTDDWLDEVEQELDGRPDDQDQDDEQET